MYVYVHVHVRHTCSSQCIPLSCLMTILNKYFVFLMSINAHFIMLHSSGTVPKYLDFVFDCTQGHV